MADNTLNICAIVLETNTQNPGCCLTVEENVGCCLQNILSFIYSFMCSTFHGVLIFYPCRGRENWNWHLLWHTFSRACNVVRCSWYSLSPFLPHFFSNILEVNLAYIHFIVHPFISLAPADNNSPNKRNKIVDVFPDLDGSVYQIWPFVKWWMTHLWL